MVGGLLATEADADTSEPVVAYVHNGEVSVMKGDREVTVRDRKLAAQIARAAK
jgi:glutamate synthase domain-containing protein 1